MEDVHYMRRVDVFSSMNSGYVLSFHVRPLVLSVSTGHFSRKLANKAQDVVWSRRASPFFECANVKRLNG